MKRFEIKFINKDHEISRIIEDHNDIEDIVHAHFRGKEAFGINIIHDIKTGVVVILCVDCPIHLMVSEVKN